MVRFPKGLRWASRRYGYCIWWRPAKRNVYTGGGLTREGFAQKFNLDPESVNIDTLSFSNPANYMFEVSGKKKDSGADVTGTTRATGSLPIEGLLDTVMEKNIEDPFERMRFQVDLSNLKKPYLIKMEVW